MEERDRYGLSQDVLMWVYGLGSSLTALLCQSKAVEFGKENEFNHVSMSISQGRKLMEELDQRQSFT